jgi:glycosyltransferase involved in cell wall biosynthesis
MTTRQLLRERGVPPLLSIIIPAYNEEASLPALRRELSEFLAKLPCPVEIIIVNDGSGDGTLNLLATWAAEDSRIKVISLARNFGHQAAITAGLDFSKGDAVVILDADLQDPPQVILEMLDRYRQGYEIVYGQRLSRAGEGPFKRFSAWMFYRLMRLLVYRDLPPDTGDFRLVSRLCLDALKEMREMHRFLRGMIAWTGLAQTCVTYERQPRLQGSTHYSLWKMLRFAWTAAISFSVAPLRISLVMGLIVALAGFAEGIYAIDRFFAHDTVRGWTSAITITCFIGGAILISIGILGEYVGRVFEASKGRPLYIVAATANLDGQKSA